MRAGEKEAQAKGGGGRLDGDLDVIEIFFPSTSHERTTASFPLAAKKKNGTPAASFRPEEKKRVSSRVRCGFEKSESGRFSLRIVACNLPRRHRGFDSGRLAHAVDLLH